MEQFIRRLGIEVGKELMSVPESNPRKNSLRSKFRRPKAKIYSVYGTLFWLLKHLGIPFVLKKITNQKLKNIPFFEGHVEGLQFHMLEGKCVISGIELVPKDMSTPNATLFIEKATIQFHWLKMLNKGIVCSIFLEKPDVIMRLPADDKEWKFSGYSPEKIRSALPFQIHRLDVKNGEIHFVNLPGQNGTDVAIYEMDATAENITNAEHLSGTTMSQLTVRGKVLSSGRLHVHAEMDLLAEKPLFNVDTVVQNIELSDLNFIFRPKAGAIVQQGNLDVYAEMAAANGGFKGYVKPIIDNARIERLKNVEFTTKMKGYLALLTAAVLRNRSKDRIATRFNIEGQISHPDLGLWPAIKNALWNSFIKGLSPGLENNIDLMSVAQQYDPDSLSDSDEETSRFKQFWTVLKESAIRWKNDQAAHMGAALSYYTAFSMAPLLLLAVAIAGLLFNNEAVQSQLMSHLSLLFGMQSAQTIQTMLLTATKPASGIIAAVIGVCTLLLGASAVMNELKRSLNKIWRVTHQASVISFFKDRLRSMSMVLTIGFFLLVSLVVNSALVAFGHRIENVLTLPQPVLQTINMIVSYGIITLLFAMLFKYLPDAKIKWSDVWLGAAFTTLLFSIGKFFIGLYLGRGLVGSSYGAAGSLLIILVWIYYSAQIFYFGAEFTKVYSERTGSHRVRSSFSS